MGGWTAMRANPDHLIIRKAVEAGAELQEGDIYEKWRWALTRCLLRRWKR